MTAMYHAQNSCPVCWWWFVVCGGIYYVYMVPGGHSLSSSDIHDAPHRGPQEHPQKNTYLREPHEDELRHNQIQHPEGEGRGVDAPCHARLPDVVAHALGLVPRDGLADAALHLGAEQRRQLPPLVGDARLVNGGVGFVWGGGDECGVLFCERRRRVRGHNILFRINHYITIPHPPQLTPTKKTNKPKTPTPPQKNKALTTHPDRAAGRLRLQLLQVPNHPPQHLPIHQPLVPHPHPTAATAAAAPRNAAAVAPTWGAPPGGSSGGGGGGRRGGEEGGGQVVHHVVGRGGGEEEAAVVAVAVAARVGVLPAGPDAGGGGGGGSVRCRWLLGCV